MLKFFFQKYVNGHGHNDLDLSPFDFKIYARLLLSYRLSVYEVWSL